MNPKIVLAALAALSIAALTIPAEARQAHQPPGWVDVAAQPAYPMASAASRQASHRRSASRLDGANANQAKRTHQRAANRAMLIDKPQLYVAPTSPNDKLVTREVHEKGSGIVRSRKTGATARVSPRFAPIAQAVVDDLERGGATIRFMGGYRRGPCWSGRLPPCGLAVDLCQTARGIVDGRCNLPSRAVEAKIAAAHGALSGGVWCNQDRGHIQLGQTAGACGRNLYAAVAGYHAKVRHHGKRVRYAARRQ